MAAAIPPVNMLPFIGKRERIEMGATYTIYIPKLSKNLINVHLINEANIFRSLNEANKIICKERFIEDYFHVLKIVFPIDPQLSIFNIFDNLEHDYNYDIINRINLFNREVNYPFNVKRLIEYYLGPQNLLDDYTIYIDTLIGKDFKQYSIREEFLVNVNITQVHSYNYAGFEISKINIINPYCIDGLTNILIQDNKIPLDDIPEHKTLIFAHSPLFIMDQKINPILLSKDYINPNKRPVDNYYILFLLIGIIQYYYLPENDININQKYFVKLLNNININFIKIFNELINYDITKTEYTGELFDTSFLTFRFGQQVIRMFYEYVYSQRKIIHVDESYYINPVQNNYLLGTGVTFNLNKYPGLIGIFTFLLNMDKNFTLDKRILIKDYQCDINQLAINLKNVISTPKFNMRTIIKREFEKSKLKILNLYEYDEYLFNSLNPAHHIYNIHNIYIPASLPHFCWTWTQIIDAHFPNSIMNPENRFYAKLNFAYEIIKLNIFCSGLKFFDENPTIAHLLIKTSGGSLGLGIDLLSRDSINTFNFEKLNNIIDYISKREVISRILMTKNEEDMIYHILINFLILYTNTEKLVYQELVLKPICDLSTVGEEPNIIYNCFRDNKYLINDNLAKGLDEKKIDSMGRIPPAEEIYYKNLFVKNSIKIIKETDDPFEPYEPDRETLCFLKAPAKIRIFVFVGKYNNKYFSIIPEIGNFEYLMPFREEELFTDVQVNSMVGGKNIFKSKSHRFISNNLSRFNSDWSKHIMRPRSIIDNHDTQICMYKIYPELKKLAKLLSKDLIKTNLPIFNRPYNMGKNLIGRYAIDILYKEDEIDENCKLKVIDINNGGALMDLRAGYDTILLLLKMSENNDFFNADIPHDSGIERINEHRYHFKIFERLTSDLYMLGETPFSNSLKLTRQPIPPGLEEEHPINKGKPTNPDNPEQRFIIALYDDIEEELVAAQEQRINDLIFSIKTLEGNINGIYQELLAYRENIKHHIDPQPEAIMKKDLIVLIKTIRENLEVLRLEIIQAQSVLGDKPVLQNGSDEYKRISRIISRIEINELRYIAHILKKRRNDAGDAGDAGDADYSRADKRFKKDNNPAGLGGGAVGEPPIKINELYTSLLEKVKFINENLLNNLDEAKIEYYYAQLLFIYLKEERNMHYLLDQEINTKVLDIEKQLAIIKPKIQIEIEKIEKTDKLLKEKIEKERYNIKPIERKQSLFLEMERLSDKRRQRDNSITQNRKDKREQQFNKQRGIEKKYLKYKLKYMQLKKLLNNN
jgi:hypothetical protein